MGLIKWVAILTCGHCVGDSTVAEAIPYDGMPFACPLYDCHSTTVVGVVTDVAMRDTAGRL